MAESLKPELVQEFVGKAHGDLEAVKKLLTHEPGLLNAYSEKSWTVNPESLGHQIRKLLDRHSGNSWTPIPESLGQVISPV